MEEPHRMSCEDPHFGLATGVRDLNSQATRNILLLDGVRLFVHFEQTLLQREDYKIFTASNGERALEILDEETIDLVLMDYVLPDCDGDEIVRKIRSHPTNKHAGIIIVTARGMREHVDSCMAAGCDSFLFKPVSRSVLCSRVQEALSVPARRHVRTLVRLQVNARNRDRFFFGSTINLSVGGVLLSSTLDLSLGEALSLRFFLPGDEQAVACDSRVVRKIAGEGDEEVYGIVFEKLSRADQDRVEAFVARENEGSSSELQDSDIERVREEVK